MRPTVLATTVVVSKTAAWARDTEAQLDSGEKEVSEEDEAHKGSTSWAGLKHWNTGCLSQMGLNPNSPGTYIFFPFRYSSSPDGSRALDCPMALQRTQQPLLLRWMPEASQFFLVCFQFRASPFFLATAPHRSSGFVHLLLLLTWAAAPLWVLASRSLGWLRRSSN